MKTTLVKELKPLVGKVSEEKLRELDLFFVNSSLDTKDRKKLVNILVNTINK